MNNTVKKSLWIGGWVLSVLAAFGAGAWGALSFFGMLQATPFLVRELAEAVQTQHYLEYLDKDASDEARRSLNLTLDGQILAIATLLENTSSDKDRETARRFLRRVADYRKRHPAQYPESIKSPEMDEVQRLVAEILGPSASKTK